MAWVGDTSSAQGVTYWATMRHFQTGQLVLNQILWHLIVPILVAGWSLSVGFQAVGFAEILGGLAILTGFLFTLDVFIFQLRTQMLDTTVARLRTSLKRLVDELFAQVNWAICVALVAVGGSIFVATSTQKDDGGDALPLAAWATAILVLVITHLLGLLWTCATRTKAAYSELIKVMEATEAAKRAESARNDSATAGN